jgi:predicted Fe-Mo cluster-binding NifX family protein
MAFEAVDNPAVGAAGGAGIQAAQFIVEQGADAVISGNVGPNAFDVLEAANVPVYLFNGGTVRDAVTAYKAGDLPNAGAATAPEHAGMGRGGSGRGRGRRVATQAATPPTPEPAREKEIATLKKMASDLRQQLAEILERIDRLERGA